jgi:hypothetical protein
MLGVPHAHAAGLTRRALPLGEKGHCNAPATKHPHRHWQALSPSLPARPHYAVPVLAMASIASSASAVMGRKRAR